MAQGLIDSAAAGPAGEHRFLGVTLAQVINNVDLTGRGRVQVSLPWMPGFEPWARVASPSAGSGRGIYFIPQVDDEVLVAFNQGDLRDAYVVGSLWNGVDDPPRTGPTDPVSQRVVKTPAGHEIELDDLAQSITITSSSGHTITVTPDAITLAVSGDAAKVTLESAGRVAISASTEVSIEAPTIGLSGANVEVKGSGTATLDGGGACTISAGVVKIN